MTFARRKDFQLSASQIRWKGFQRRIGITGGIASGKSSVTEFISKVKKLPILDTDVYSRDVLADGTISTKTVLKRYGDSVRAIPHAAIDQLNRKALAEIIFNDAKERAWLEELVHPIISKRLDEDLENNKNHPNVIIIIPLLFETKMESICSEIWLVDCHPEQQIQRLMLRENLTTQEAKIRIAAQWPIELKRQLSDVIIKNDGEEKGWSKQVKLLIDKL